MRDREGARERIMKGERVCNEGGDIDRLSKKNCSIKVHLL